MITGVAVNQQLVGFNNTTKTFTAEASELPFGWVNGVKVTLPNDEVRTFYLHHTHYNEGDVTHWTFVYGSYKMIIFND